MKRYILTLLFAASSLLTMAQNYPIYSNYFFDPFLYNVGYVGVSGFTELNINYRQQWAGIEDAPTTSTFNLQIPTKGNLSYAFSAYSENAVLLTNSVAYGTFGYRVPFSEEHFINFGLAAGVGMSSIDINGLDPSDPAVLNAFSTSYYLDGQFGAYYEFKNLNIGVSLPKLFDSNTFSVEQFQEFKFAALNNIIYTLNYKFELPNSMFSVTPYLIYRTGENIQKQIEATGILKYKDVVYLGGSYRVDYGPSLFFGFGFKKIVDFGYAYEMATEQVAGLGQGSHEFQIRIRLGKQKRNYKPKEDADPVMPITEPEPPLEEDIVEEPPIEPVEEEIPPMVIIAKDSVPSKDHIEEVILVVPKDSEELVDKPITVQTDGIQNLSTGIYIIVGAFNVKQNAINYSLELMNQGYKNNIGMSNKGFYCVYGQSTNDINEAKLLRKRTAENEQFNFKNAWILEIE